MIKEHFRSRGYIEGGIVKNIHQEAILDMEALPPFLRTLLVTDGTVTKSLEAFFWENIKVEKIWQNLVWLKEDLPLIDALAGDNAVKRDVLLRGCESDDVYAYATSYLLPDALDEDIKNQLIEGKIGIGELLREIGLETYREIAEFGREMYRPNFEDPESTEYVETIYRIYVIKIGGKPAIQITERFPYRLFQQKN